jgi:hypothetical protein
LCARQSSAAMAGTRRRTRATPMAIFPLGWWRRGGVAGSWCMARCCTSRLWQGQAVRHLPDDLGWSTLQHYCTV